MSETYALRCQNLSKAYGKRVLFSSLSLELRASERLALLGASGSGKSTLLHCLSGVTPCDAGEILLGGQRLTSLGPEQLAACRRRSIGTIFQFFHLLPTLTASENIELPLQLIGQAKHERRRRVEELLDRMQISGRAAAFPSELSGGEMQRVAIARAVAHRPTVIFADEPTGNLDSQSGEAVLQLLQEITAEENAALLMVTHSEEAAAICPQRLHLRDGKLLSS